VTLLVSEVFGPTVQGEGPSLGRRCGFVRLGLCNLDCAWCDTPYTWDWTGKNGPAQDRAALDRFSNEGLTGRIAVMGVDRVVITGGEPLVQRKPLAEWLGTMPGSVRNRVRFEVETNGTLAPGRRLLDLVDRWNVSPKLPHSGVPLERAWRPEVLSVYAQAESAAFKVVCRDADDVDLVAHLAEEHRLPAESVWIMPEGITAEDVNAHGAAIADAAIAAGFNVTTRLHVQLWGNERRR
jgi:7-carboxy-7-deazaguanine synthase